MVFHQRQTPLFKLVNSGVNVTRHIKGKILTNHTHQIHTRITDVILRIVFAEACTHVTVDRIKTLGYCTGTIDVCFFCNDNFLVLAPVSCFKCSTGTTEARTCDQDVDIVFNNSFVAH